MPYRVVWRFEQRVPSYDGKPAQIEEADELWWSSADFAQLYAALMQRQVGASGFRLEPADAK